MGEASGVSMTAAAVLVAAHVLSLSSSGSAGVHAAAELRRGDRIVVGIVQAYPSVEYVFAAAARGQAAAEELAARHDGV